MSKNHPDPIDMYVGNRIRLRRMEVRVSQELLGDKLGLTFQQIQKYEKAANRVSASKLFQISQILDVPIEYFFSGIEEAQTKRKIENSNMGEDITQFVSTREGVELNRHFQKISDPNIRKKIIGLANVVSE